MNNLIICQLVFFGVGYTNEKDDNARTENRTRDYTPSQFTPDAKHFLYNRLKDWQHSVGAPAFSRILNNQIIPFVENHYNIKHSSRPLIISPSLWWDDWAYPRHQRAINKLATSSAAIAYSRSTRIYFAVGDDEERMGMVTDIYVLTNMLVKQQRPNLQIAVDVMTDMNHEGAFPQGFMRGIVGLFSEPQVKAHPIDKRLVWR